MDEAMRAELERLRDEDRRQNRRIELLEDSVRNIQDLVLSVHTLAHDMKQMLDELQDHGSRLDRQGERLEKLEHEPARKWARMGDKALDKAVGILAGGAITGIVVLAVQYIK